MGGGDRKNSESSKRRSDSYDSPAEKRLHQERIPLENLVDQPDSLATVAVSALSWDLVVGMLPSYLKVGIFLLIFTVFSPVRRKKS